jgi:hypothetical protein
VAKPQAQLSLGYTVELDGKSVEVSFAAPASDTKADLVAASTKNAAALQSAIEQLVGKGNVVVTADTTMKTVWGFRIEFQNGAAAKDLGLLTVTPNAVTEGRLTFNASTVSDGTKGATTADQAALIQSALDDALGVDAVTVAAEDGGRYRLSFGGTGYGSKNLAQVRSVEESLGVTVTADTLVEGSSETGPAYLLDATSLTGFNSFSVEFTIDGVTYVADGLSTTIDTATTQPAMAAAASEAVEPANELQRLRITHTASAVDKAYTLSSDGGQSAQLLFNDDAELDAAALQAAIEKWFGVGSVVVTLNAD